jgi:ubiquitin C-terminal hydrolase
MICLKACTSPFAAAVKNILSNGDQYHAYKLLPYLTKQLNAYGQEGAAPGLTAFISALDHPLIDSLFLNKYNYSIRCPNCRKKVSEEQDFSTFVEWPTVDNRPVSAQDLQSALLMNVQTATDYRCPACAHKHAKIERVAILRQAREIIVVTRKPADATKFEAPTLVFPGRLRPLVYRPVAIIEHSGALSPTTWHSSGHYWTLAARYAPNGKPTWAIANDEHIGPTFSAMSASAHLIFYHLFLN